MARRSATNQRYQKHGAPTGKTRKSAAAAKPKRDAGAPSASGSGKQSISKDRKEAARKAWASPGTLEFTKLRRLWWGAFGAAVALLVVSLLINQKVPNSPVSVALSWASLGLLGIGFYLDIRKIRPIRDAAHDAALNPGAAKKPAEKPAEESPTDDQS